MTIASTTSRARFSGNGATTQFPLPFRVLDATHVVVRRITGDTATVLTLGSDFSVIGVGGVLNASVTLTAPLPAGSALLVVRQVPVLQPTDIKNQGAFFPSIHEDVFDRLTMIDQQQDTDIARTLQLDAVDEDGTGAYDAKGNRITAVGDPIAETDAVNLRTVAGLTRSDGTTDTFASANFTNDGRLRINVLGPSTATQVSAAVSLFGPPTVADLSEASGTLTSMANQAALITASAYNVGDTVYVAAVSYLAGVPSRIVRLTITRDAVPGTVAAGPSYSVQQTVTDTQVTITYSGIGTPVLSENGGAFATAPASPIVRARPAAGSNTVGTLTLKWSAAGQELSQVFLVLPQAAVGPSFSVRQTLTDTQSSIDYTGTAELSENGGAWAAAPASPIVRARAAAGSNTVTTLALRWSVAGQTLSQTFLVPAQAPVLPPAAGVRVISSDATTTTVQVSTSPTGGTVRWIGGTAARVSGPLLNVSSPDGTTWVFQRPAFRTGDAESVFRVTVGAVSDDDTVTITEQGKDTVPMLLKAAVTATTPTTYTVRVSASQPSGADMVAVLRLANLSGLSATLDGSAVSEGQEWGLMGSTADGFYGTGAVQPYFRDFVIERPTIGNQPARVQFVVRESGSTGLFSPDSDSVDIVPQVAATPGRVTVQQYDQSGALYFVRFRAFEADGTQITSTGRMTATLFVTPVGGSPTSTTTTVTWDAGNAWFSVGITRATGELYSLRLSVSASGATGQGETTIPIPTYVVTAVAGTPRIATLSVVAVPSVPANGTSGVAFNLNYTLGDAPAGAVVSALLTPRGVATAFPNIITGDQVATGRPLANGSGGVFLTLYTLSGTVTLSDASGNVLQQRTITPVQYYGN